jgi:uncharacterized protein YukE
MAFNETEIKIIQAGKEAGKSRADVEKALFNYRNGIIPTKTTSLKDETVNDIKQTVSDIKNTFSETQIKQSQALEAGVRGEQGLLRSFGQATGAGAQGLSNTIGDVFKGLVKTVLPSDAEQTVKETAQSVIKPIVNSAPVKLVIDKYNSLDEKTKRDVDALIGIGSLALDFYGGESTKELASNIARKSIKLGGETIDNVTNYVRSGKSLVGKSKDVKTSIIDFLAPEADDSVKTILKESTPNDINKFVKIQEQAVKDTRAITPYEYIGDNIANATKQLETKLKDIGRQKSDILKPLNKGLDPFENQSIIDDLVSLRNSKSDLQVSDISLIDDIITRAKNVKTKGGADKFIDDVQDLIYTGNRNQTLPSGSRLDKQLQGILGKYNGELKKSLPKEYAELNAKWSEIKSITETLNSALGEVVDGVSTRGGSLVKQFFSPNGRKAKELFDYIKTETGIDLAKDATLARYVMELFDDPRARTLLGGEIPTSVSGLTDKAIDLIVEKTGVGKSIQNSQRQGAIRNAKKLTQP